MKKEFVVIIALVGYVSSAQMFGQDIYGLSIPTQAKTYVFGDKVNVRNAPSKDAGVQGQLLIGEEVYVIDTMPERMTLNGRTDRWYKIRYNGNKTGYLWGGLLSFSALESNGVRFVYNFTEVKGAKGQEDYEFADYVAELRAVRDGKILDKSTASFRIDRSYYTTGTVEKDARGLSGYQNLIQINLGYDACGYTNYDWYALWDGNKFAALEPTSSISDGGVFFHSETYLFPNEASEKGLAPKLYFSVEHGETDEDDSEKGWHESKPMVWNGKRFLRPKIIDPYETKK